MMRRPTPRSEAIWFIVHATVPDCEITLIEPGIGIGGRCRAVRRDPVDVVHEPLDVRTEHRDPGPEGGVA
jgi:hypothetical protein